MFARGADIAVVPESMLNHSARHVSLFPSGLACLVWAGHPTIGDAITIEQYREARHVAMTASTERLSMIGEAIHPLSVGRRIVTRTGRYSALPNLIVGTDLIVTLNDWLAQHLACHYPLRLVQAPFLIQPVMLFAQYEAHRHGDQAIRWTIEHMVAAKRRMVAD